MQIQDLSVAVQDAANVRGGANFASNYSSNGPVLSGVFVGGSHFNNSPIDVTNTVVQQNTTDQHASVEDIYTSKRDLSITNAQIDLSGFWGRF